MAEFKPSGSVKHLINAFEALSGNQESNVQRLIKNFGPYSEKEVSLKYRKSPVNAYHPQIRALSAQEVRSKIDTEIAKEEMVKMAPSFTTKPAAPLKTEHLKNLPERNSNEIQSASETQKMMEAKISSVTRKVDESSELYGRLNAEPYYSEVHEPQAAEEHIYEEVHDDEIPSIYKNVGPTDLNFERSDSFVYVPAEQLENIYDEPYESSSVLERNTPKQEKSKKKSIEKFTENPDFLYFFNKYIESNKDALEKLNADLNCQTRDMFFLLMISDAFCQIKDGKDPKVGKGILYYYKNTDGIKTDFLYNKSYPGDSIIRAINKDFEKGSFSNLFSYMHYHCDKDPIVIAFNVIQSIEHRDNPSHEINRDEMQCALQKLCDFKSVMDESKMSFEGAYRFYEEHKVILNTELGLDHLKKGIKQKGHDIIERIEANLPSTKVLESRVNRFTSFVKDCASHLFNVLLYVFQVAI